MQKVICPFRPQAQYFRSLSAVREVSQREVSTAAEMGVRKTPVVVVPRMYAWEVPHSLIASLSAVVAVVAVVAAARGATTLLSRGVTVASAAVGAVPTGPMRQPTAVLPAVVKAVRCRHLVRQA